MQYFKTPGQITTSFVNFRVQKIEFIAPKRTKIGLELENGDFRANAEAKITDVGRFLYFKGLGSGMVGTVLRLVPTTRTYLVGR